MASYHLSFEFDSLRQLDDFALLCTQDYNYGHHGRWFSEFRGGLYGAYNRINGISDCYSRLHSWLPVRKTQQSTETNLANLFFNVDSCLECHVYFLNALGFCRSPESFKDVTDEKALRGIGVHNIVGTASSGPLDGYSEYFPNLVDHWAKNEDLLKSVVEQHDVSKHRKKNYIGGTFATSPPREFLSAFGGEDDFSKNFMFYPMKTIHLEPSPKTPACRKPQYKHADLIVLEELVPAFVSFINKTGHLALNDARATISLKESEFR